MSDEFASNGQNPRPHQHLSVEELRQHEHITDEEWFQELEARGIIVRAYDGPEQPLRPIVHRPGELDRFFQERGSQMVIDYA